ncbi:hypothetical protein DSM3645_02693 [Blastopirellula marina DSM 3645]|uniref:Uncharacterized protein n=1 Tax=Blastopirellula marina DSM 3645 TaxID=314230 RepID=A3ZVK2_9BACT|nr:hypothetical protein DSM3645_02693 [Blastopirellula marina DSM 3645]
MPGMHLIKHLEYVLKRRANFALRIQAGVGI